MSIRSIQPTEGTLISKAFAPPDYRDAFEVDLADGGPSTVEEFTTAYFLNQPTWLLAAGLNTISRSRIEDQIGDESYAAGSSVGTWKVHDRADGEIVFGDNMGFMEYRFGFRIDPGRPNTVEAGTAVKYL